MELEPTALVDYEHATMISPWYDIQQIGLMVAAPNTSSVPMYDFSYTGTVTLRLGQGGLRNKTEFLANGAFKSAWKVACIRCPDLPLNATGILSLHYAEGKLKKAIFSKNF
ncbi:MAG: hypothetical protein PHN92_07525 [Geobacter sp.]|nr:hypothetical protein [Geobacter sp.]